MNRTATSILAGMAAVGALSLSNPASAGAAHTGPNTAAHTVAELEDQGYKVILNKVGSAPLNECTVTAIRPGRQVTEMRSNVRDRTVERVLYTTIHVDAKC